MSSDLEMRWFHVVLTMYGAWLPGDERGFRTRKHRQHVEGDYKNPPPAGEYQGLSAHSRKSLKHDPAKLAVDHRKIICEALRDRLLGLGAVVASVAVSRTHGHVLVKLPERETRNWIGLAKKHAWHELHETGWNGKLWAKRPKCEPVGDRQHQLNVYHYILRHEQQGAFVWKHADGV